MRGQNGGSPSPTSSSDGTKASWSSARSRSATGAHVDGPTEGLCTSTNTGAISAARKGEAGEPHLEAAERRPIAVHC